MLCITVPTPDPARLAPTDPDAVAGWLHRLGPTAWILTSWLYVQTLGLAPGTQVYVEVEDLRALLGVKTDVLHKAMVRLSRYRVAYYDLGLRHLVSDGTLPVPTERIHVATAMHTPAVAA